MNIVDVVGKTIGKRNAVAMALRIPFLPKHLFGGSKFRYFNRYNLDQEAADHIKALVRRPGIPSAIRLHQIMSSYGPLLCDDPETVDSLRKLRRLLNDWQPKSRRQAYRKIRSLINCFEFDRAMEEFHNCSHLLKESQIEEIRAYFDNTKEVLEYFAPYVETAWENTLKCKDNSLEGNVDNLIVFYLPPSLTKLAMGSDKGPAFYRDTIVFFKNLHESIPRNLYKVNEKLQFSWRTIKEPEGKYRVVSYHTKGSNGNSNVRIKEAAFPNYFTVDSTGFSGWHSVADLEQNVLDSFLAVSSQKGIEATFSHLNEKLVKSNQSKYSQSDRNTEPAFFDDDFFFLALQVENDIVADLAYLDTYNLLKSAAEIAVDKHINLVIKRHPKCTSAKIGDLLNHLKSHKHIQVSDASIHSILPACKAVITVNSGVGMEALLHLKGIICTGKAEYSYIAATARSRSELERVMLDFTATDPARIKEFLHYYSEEHLYHMDDVEKMRRFWINARNK